MEKKKRLTETGTSLPDEKYRIKIVPNGPYLVYGNPTIQQEILTLNEEEIPWEYAKGHCYSTPGNPTALCRCGHSGNHPYCDGSHTRITWDSTLTASNSPLLEKAESYDGPTLELADPVIVPMSASAWPNIQSGKTPGIPTRQKQKTMPFTEPSSAPPED